MPIETIPASHVYICDRCNFETKVRSARNNRDATVTIAFNNYDHERIGDMVTEADYWLCGTCVGEMKAFFKGAGLISALVREKERV